MSDTRRIICLLRQLDPLGSLNAENSSPGHRTRLEGRPFAWDPALLAGAGISARKPSLFRLVLQKRLLAGLSPAISAHVTVTTHDAVTGDHHRDVIRGARARDGPRCRRAPDGGSHFLIRTPFPGGNRLECLPDGPLKRRPVHVQRHAGARVARVANARKNG